MQPNASKILGTIEVSYRIKLGANSVIKYLSKFIFILDKRRIHLVYITLLFLITSFLDTLGIGLVGPFIFLINSPKIIHTNSLSSWIYFQLNLKTDAQFIALFGLVIVTVFYIKSFLTFRVQKYVLQFSYTQQGELSKKLLHAYLSAPYVYFLNKNTATLIQNIFNESRNFANGIMLPILNSASYAIISIFLAALLIKTSPSATIGILVVLLIPILLYQHFKHKLSRWGKEGSIANVGLLRTVNHSLGGLKETRIIGCEAYFENQMADYIKGFETSISQSQVFKLLPRILIEAVLITFLVGFTSLFLLSSQNPENLTGVLGVFAMASIRLLPSIGQLTNSAASLRSHSYTLNTLYHELKELQELQELQKGITKPDSSANSAITQPDAHALSFSQQIVLDQVSYSYPSSSALALEEINLTIKKGQAIALIGKSGAGKTTLVDIILGLLTPDQGDITVDGYSVYSNVRAWQNLIGYIPQSIFLMDDTLARNIAFGLPDQLIDFQRLEKSIKDAQLNELVESLPNGVETVIGERGMRLSGGQRQRIGIARALYHEREILVLDEATAALDNETERLVSQAIQSLSGTKTLIIIAHRLTTIEHCDYVYLMEKGRIVKSGTYEEVVPKNFLSEQSE